MSGYHTEEEQRTITKIGTYALLFVAFVGFFFNDYIRLFDLGLLLFWYLHEYSFSGWSAISVGIGAAFLISLCVGKFDSIIAICNFVIAFGLTHLLVAKRVKR